MLEKTIKKAVKKRLKELGCYQFWPVTLGMGESTLDAIICYQGKFIAIETKAPGLKPTLRQNITIDKIRKAGGIVFVVDNLEDAKRLFDGRVPT